VTVKQHQQVTSPKSQSSLQKSKAHFAKTNKLSEWAYAVVIGLPKSRVVRKQSSNGEIHFIIPELDEDVENTEDFDDSQLKMIMKKEASKPLLLLRTE
jgi:hypothetical protein